MRFAKKSQNPVSNAEDGLPILLDVPASDPKLGYESYIDAIARVIRGCKKADGESSSSRTSLTIGIFGDWGTGKTSILQGIKNRLANDDDLILCDFDAWRYEKSSDVLTGLSLAINTHLNDKDLKASIGKGIKDIEASVKGLLRTSALQQLLAIGSLFTQHTVGVDIKGAIDTFIEGDAEQCDPVSSLKQLSEALTGAHKRMVILVDDLDRCLPETVASTLETVSSFTDCDGFIFILALDRNYLVDTIGRKYGNSKDGKIDRQFGERFLEKIIQLPINVPRIRFDSADSFETLFGAKEWEAVRLAGFDDALQKITQEVIIPHALRNNPRQIKRFFNTCLMQLYINADQFADNAGNRMALIYLMALYLGFQSEYGSLSREIDQRRRQNTPDDDKLLNKIDSLGTVQDATREPDEADDRSATDSERLEEENLRAFFNSWLSNAELRPEACEIETIAQILGSSSMSAMSADGSRSSAPSSHADDGAEEASETKKPGRFAREDFLPFLKSDECPEEVIASLTSSAFSKEHLRTNMPVLVTKAKGDANDKEVLMSSGHLRYYSVPVKIKGEEYYLYSQWYQHQLEPMKNFIRSMQGGVTTGSVN